MGLMLAEPGFHTRCYVEWEEYPRSVIIAAQRAGYFAPAPIWDDLTTFDGRPFRGAIDTILAGYPCQPFSQAGQRRGEDDERHLWPDVARVIREIGPTWVFLENVAGHVTLGLETVLRALWDMGFTPAVGLFSAAETGAPHERLRIFMVAHCDVRGREPFSGNSGVCRTHYGTGEPAEQFSAIVDPMAHRQGRDGRGEQPARAETVRSGETVGDASGIGRGKGRSEPEFRGGRDSTSSAGGTMADASGGSGYEGGASDKGSGDREGREREATGIGGHRPCLFPPGPGDGAAWSAVLTMAPGLAPSVAFGDIARRAQQLVALDEAGQLAQAAAESELRRMVDGMASRSRALRLLGNGVFSLAAGHAWRTLADAHGLRPLDLVAASDGDNGGADEFDMRAAE